MSDTMVGVGGGLAMGGAVAKGLGYAGGDDLMGSGLGLAGAGIGVGMLESVGEGMQRSARRRR
jgi:hypothetical protein